MINKFLFIRAVFVAFLNAFIFCSKRFGTYSIGTCQGIGMSVCHKLLILVGM